MKKHFFYLIILIGLFSCNNDELLFNDAKQQSKDGLELKSSGDGKYDLLGFGYDVTGEYLNDESSRFQVVDIDEFLKVEANKSSYNEKGALATVSNMYSGATSEDFLKEIKTKNKIGTNGSFNIGIVNLGGNLSGSVDINNKYTYSTKYSFARVDLVKKVKQLQMNAEAKDFMPYLNSKFIKDIKEKSADQIIANYGTHVLFDISIGARLQFDYRSVIIEEGNRSEKKGIVEAGANFNVALIKAGGTAHHEIEENRELNKKNATWNLKLKSYGNSHSGIGELYFSNGFEPTKVPFNLKEWEQTAVAKGAALIAINWDKAYPIYEFVADPVKKAEIKVAMEKHINSKRIDILELSPLYEYWNAGANDHYYTTEFASTMGGGYWKYNNVVVGYIHTKNINASSPLYEYWDGKGSDHYYNTGYALTMGGGAWKYNGITGYVFKSKIGETVPLFEYWNAGAHDHYYSTEFASTMGGGAWKYNGVTGYLYPVK